MAHSVKVKFGDDSNNQVKVFTFETNAEREAFMMGLAEMDGWNGYDYIKSEADNFDTWGEEEQDIFSPGPVS